MDNHVHQQFKMAAGAGVSLKSGYYLLILLLLASVPSGQGKEPTEGNWHCLE